MNPGEEEYPGPERRTGEDRRQDHTVSVKLDGLQNGAKKWFRRIIGSGGVVLLAVAGWFVKNEVRQVQQDQRIGQHETAQQVIDRALSDSQREVLEAVRENARDIQDLREEMHRNREGIGVLDSDVNGLRRDVDRILQN